MFLRKPVLLFALLLLLGTAGYLSFPKERVFISTHVIEYTADPQKQDLRLYWKDDQGQILGNIGNLKNWLDKTDQKLVFAMNAGMFKPDHSTQGLFIQEGRTLAPLDTASGDGNFYLQPNGVFYTTTGHRAVVCKTEDFRAAPDIDYATQSGPLLLIDGQIHPAFREGSLNLHIRNGVGILPDGRVLFAISEGKINLYDFARYFQQMGCKNALYLDGFVSRMYCPERNYWQMDGELGALFGITEN